MVSVIKFLTAWKCPGAHFLVFGLTKEIYAVLSPNTGKYEPEKTPYLDTFYAVSVILYIFSWPKES